MDLLKYIPKGSVSQKNLLSLKNVTEDDIMEFLKLSIEFKHKRLAKETSYELLNKHILVLSKPDYLLTNLTFQFAVRELSGNILNTTMTGESLENTLSENEYVKALSSLGLNAVVVCTNKVSDAKIFRNNLNVPVINANARFGPCVAISALLTVFEHFRKINGLKIVIAGNCNDEESSVLYGFIKLGANVTLLVDENHEPSEKVLSYANQFGEIEVTTSKACLKTADVLYIGYASENSTLKITEGDVCSLKDTAVITSAVPSCKIMADSAVFADAKSIITKQASNLIHVEKSVLSLLVGEKD